MKAFRKVLVITLAVMMTATMMLPDFYGGFFSYAENEAVTEESADGQTEDIGDKDSSGTSEESADVEKASEKGAEKADAKEDESADKKADKEKEAKKSAKEPVELSFEGADFDVSVSGDEKAGLTDETGLEVKEIKSGKRTARSTKSTSPSTMTPWTRCSQRRPYSPNSTT